MKNTIIATLCLFLFYGTLLQAQKAKAVQKIPRVNTWQTLSLVTLDKKFDEMLGIDIEVPNFSAAIRKLEGKTVTLQGYILPLEGRRTQKYFIFSAYPYDMCFFCGGAGPESVAEVYTKKPIRYTNKMIKIKGRLVLNNSGSIDQLFYVLQDAVVIQ